MESTAGTTATGSRGQVKDAAALLEAAADGEAGKAQKIAASLPFSVDVEDHEGNTPLSEAACYGELDVVTESARAHSSHLRYRVQILQLSFLGWTHFAILDILAVLWSNGECIWNFAVLKLRLSVFRSETRCHCFSG